MSTREEWLDKAVELLEPLFIGDGGMAEMPRVRVSIGFPPKGGLGQRQVLGVCCSKKMASDEIPQIYINPTVSDVCGKQGILAILVHELIHACGVRGHGKDFRKLGLYVGLEGKMSCSTANESLQRYFETIVGKRGDFPHASLSNILPDTKPDKCRMFKCECKKCGYTVRVANKWIKVAIPRCPICELELDKEEKDV